MLDDGLPCTSFQDVVIHLNEVVMSLRIATLSLFAAAWLATPAQAASATGAEILAAIAGNTVQGAMEASGPYAEFYAADGTIKGQGYGGAWTVEGDAMCFQYGTDPKTCWQVEIAGDQVTWIQDGKAQGTGTVVAGNPNNF